MVILNEIDLTIFIWINRWVGTSKIFDNLMSLVVSDYLIPVASSMVLLGVWFGWKTEAMRKLHQRSVLVAGAGVLIANGLVTVSNMLYFRERPFDVLDVNLLFYQPTDSSFPSNPTAIIIAISLGICIANKKLGKTVYCIAIIYGFSRVYAGVCYPGDILAGVLLGHICVFLARHLIIFLDKLVLVFFRVTRYFCLS